MISARLFYRLVGIVYGIAYLSLYPQYRGLVGYNGLLPADQLIDRTLQHFSRNEPSVSIVDMYLKTGNLFVFSTHLGIPVDCLAELLLWIGMASSVVLASGIIHPALFLISWIIYVSFIHNCQTFLSFQWDILLSECGFLCAITTCFFDPQAYKASMWPFRFLLWKLMFLSGVVKLQSKCPTWENLTALNYHFATQCLPTSLAWYAHQLPPLFLRLGVAMTLLIEILWTFMLLAPLTYIRRIGVIFQLILQLLISMTGNYNFFNILTIVLMLPCWISDFTITNHRSTLSRIDSESIGKSVDTILSKVATDGLFVSIMELIRYADRTWIGFWSQLIFSLAFLSASFLCMININLKSNYPWWVGDSIQLIIRWDDIRDYLPVWSIGAMIATLIFIALMYAQDLDNNLKKLSTLTSRIAFAINMFKIGWSSTGMLMLFGWILLSASDINAVGNMSGYIPQLITDFKRVSRPFLLTSSYGLFRQMTGIGKDIIPSHYPPLQLQKVARPEIVLEGYDSNLREWLRIDFLYKPSGKYHRPPFIAPHQPRLDWQMWFAALGSYHHNPWLVHLIYKLLNPPPKVSKEKEIDGIETDDSSEIMALIDANAYPFKYREPQSIRATLYDYDFTKWNSSDIFHEFSFNNQTTWWEETNPREYLPPLEANNPSIKEYLKANGIISRTFKSTKNIHSECINMKLNYRERIQWISPSWHYWIDIIHDKACGSILMPIDRNNCWNSIYYQFAISVAVMISLPRLYRLISNPTGIVYGNLKRYEITNKYTTHQLSRLVRHDGAV